jgi:hypothetical protein
MSAGSAILGIEALATEAHPERLSVSFLREAEYLPPFVVVEDAVAARAQGQAQDKTRGGSDIALAGTR